MPDGERTLQRLAGFAAALLLMLAACAEAPDGGRPGGGERRDAAALVDSARAAAGARRLDRAVVAFGFRGERFRLRHAGGDFAYTRTFRDSLGRRVRDVLTNDTLRRHVDGEPVPLDSAAYRAAETSVNSVAYFALLPAPLGDPAVQASDAGADTVRGTPYRRVAVQFAQQGGGRDWEDRFVYWFDARDYSMDYLAYAYGLGPSEEYGTRFREAFNVRRPGGVRFADYRNYAPRIDSLPPDDLARYGALLDADSLRLVSTVALDSVRVLR